MYESSRKINQSPNIFYPPEAFLHLTDFRCGHAIAVDVAFSQNCGSLNLADVRGVKKDGRERRPATWNPIKRSPASIFIRRVWCGWRLETARKWNGCIEATATMPWKQKRGDTREGKRDTRRRKNERDPKWNQPKRLSGTEFPHGMEDHRYRKPSTGNLASDSEEPPSLLRSRYI